MTQKVILTIALLAFLCSCNDSKEKGPVLLSEMEERVGQEHFLQLCSQMVKEDVQETAHFLNLLAALEGEKTALWFEQQLRTY